MTRTERLTPVPVGPEHVDDLVVRHAGPDVTHRYAGAWTPAQARTWAQRMRRRWRQEGAGKWRACRRGDDELVGRGGLSWTVIDGARCLELGWLVREEHRGRGHATEIGRAGLAFAFDELGADEVGADEVVAFTEVHDRASSAVVVRLGMTPAGLVHRPGLVEGLEGLQPSAPFALHRLRGTPPVAARSAATAPDAAAPDEE